MATQHIEDCMIFGGTSVEVDCATDPGSCENEPTGEANIWNPRNIIGLSADTKTISERLTAIEGQALFRLYSFNYTPNTGALEIHMNGLLLTPGVDWVEQTIATFQIVVPVVAGDQIVATGHVGITGIVDVRDTDIYVSNYQAVRDYAGTELLLYARGRVTTGDGGEDHFVIVTGAALGHYVDNDSTIILPTGGDGTIAWIRRGDLKFATLNDLIVSPSVSVGDVVETFGYYTAGDGGGNVYVIRAFGTGTVDGGFFIDLTGTAFQAEGIFGAAPIDYNTRQWGAVGDGVTDDTIQVQRAIDFLALSQGGTVMLPITTGGSVYKLNIQLNDNTSLLGGSRDVELIPAIDAPIITIDANDPVNRLTIKLLFLNGLATKGSFGAQDGILIKPNTGIIQDKVFIDECIITDCGHRGVVIDATAVGAEIREFVMHRSTVRNCASIGLLIDGDVAQTKVSSTAINNNGNENVDAESNIVIGPTEAVFVEDVSFDSCRIENDSYLVSGVSLMIFRVLGMSVTNCGFRDFFTSIKLDVGPIGQVIIQDSRFERIEAGDIESLVELVNVNGFTWTNNNVNGATTTGPVGILYSGTIENLTKIDIESNNSWGDLTRSVSDLPPSVPVSESVKLPSRNGTIPLSMFANGSLNLDTIMDEKNGTAQLVDGDEVILHIIDPLRTITLITGGNIRLDAGASFVLNEVSDIIKLMWSGYLQEWVEISRSNNSV